RLVIYNGTYEEIIHPDEDVEDDNENNNENNNEINNKEVKNENIVSPQVNINKPSKNNNKALIAIIIFVIILLYQYC
ncbi:MAG: hypothetical protein MJ211_13340, partial [Bacteroidales bacterium]|nr:hypothetical protein [Bacteroidales bacterium]